MIDTQKDSTKKLGFGFMRLPKIGDDFDIKQIAKMVDVFLENGYSYFDTAYIYQGSEEILRETVVKRYPRGAYEIATKLPIYTLTTYKDAEKIFNTSMSRLGVEYVDYYLIHGIDKAQSDKAEELGVWEFVKNLKSKGLTKHIGFSFHGTPEDLESILAMHPEAEVVQLQINYVDWDNDIIQSRRLYEIARRFNKPIIIMEPIKGGLLNSSTIAEVFKTYNPNVSVASWALRFAATLEGIKVVLSGMSDLSQVYDNIHTMNNLEPLNENDYKVIAQAVDIINNSPRIPCTACLYCMPNCPQKLKIPILMGLYSEYLVYKTTANIDSMYKLYTEDGTKASTCISCHACEQHCPQRINIVYHIAQLSALLD